MLVIFFKYSFKKKFYLWNYSLKFLSTKLNGYSYDAWFQVSYANNIKTYEKVVFDQLRFYLYTIYWHQLIRDFIYIEDNNTPLYYNYDSAFVHEILGVELYLLGKLDEFVATHANLIFQTFTAEHFFLFVHWYSVVNVRLTFEGSEAQLRSEKHQRWLAINSIYYLISYYEPKGHSKGLYIPDDSPHEGGWPDLPDDYREATVFRTAGLDPKTTLYPTYYYIQKRNYSKLLQFFWSDTWLSQQRLDKTSFISLYALGRLVGIAYEGDLDKCLFGWGIEYYAVWRREKFLRLNRLKFPQYAETSYFHLLDYLRDFPHIVAQLFDFSEVKQWRKTYLTYKFSDSFCSKLLKQTAPFALNLFKFNKHKFAYSSFPLELNYRYLSNWIYYFPGFYPVLASGIYSAVFLLTNNFLFFSIFSYCTKFAKRYKTFSCKFKNIFIYWKRWKFVKLELTTFNLFFFFKYYCFKLFRAVSAVRRYTQLFLKAKILSSKFLALLLMLRAGFKAKKKSFQFFMWRFFKKITKRTIFSKKLHWQYQQNGIWYKHIRDIN